MLTGMRTVTVYRAALAALAEHGPRRVGVTHIARLAGTNRTFVYRNWAGPQALLKDATLHELRHVLHKAREVPEQLPPTPCLAVRTVVRAAGLLREHPVVGAMARTDPALTYAAVLRPTTPWHQLAWRWLTEHVTGHLPRGVEQDTTTLAVLTTALPYALTPPQNPPDPVSERAAVDRRLGQALHACLGAPLNCPDCESS
jgi:AcrR family transcriptional regulator